MKACANIVNHNIILKRVTKDKKIDHQIAATVIVISRNIDKLTEVAISTINQLYPN